MVAEFKKLQMNISNKGLSDLKMLQDSLAATSMAEVIRSGIKIYKYLEEQKDMGKQIIVRDPKTKSETELVI